MIIFGQTPLILSIFFIPCGDPTEYPCCFCSFPKFQGQSTCQCPQDIPIIHEILMKKIHEQGNPINYCCFKSESLLIPEHPTRNMCASWSKLPIKFISLNTCYVLGCSSEFLLVQLKINEQYFFSSIPDSGILKCHSHIPNLSGLHAYFWILPQNSNKLINWLVSGFLKPSIINYELLLSLPNYWLILIGFWFLELYYYKIYI